MKATGIVRRMDDLGRVVIPKEIRRTQSIRVGDPLEIFVTGGGEVVFKKYSPVGEMNEEAGVLCEVLGKTANMQVVITDRDRVIAQSGARDLIDRPLSNHYDRAMSERRMLVPNSGNVAVNEHCPSKVSAMMPVISQGDLVGSVALVGTQPATHEQQTLVRVAASYLGRRLEQ